MTQYLLHTALIVREFDEAISWFTTVLGFDLMYDTPQPGKRWVVVAPRFESYCTVVVFLDMYGNRWDLMQLRRAA